jgi:hypothetical protein
VRRIRVVFAAGALGLFAAAPTASAADPEPRREPERAEPAPGASGCVSCHAAGSDPIPLGHAFYEWRYSAHGREGVGCEKCHGGDPTAETAEAAHQGVLPATDPASWVHPTRLAKTCGACHENESAAYAASVHARQVAERGRGATCLTCHGAMGASLPSPVELETRCSTCHESPYESKAALAMLAGAKRRLAHARGEIAALHEADPAWERNALERLDELARRYAAIQREWHTFHTPKVLQQARDLDALIAPIRDEAKQRARLGARPEPSPAP